MAVNHMEKTMEKEMDTTVRRVIQGTYCSEYTCITEYSTKTMLYGV